MLKLMVKKNITILSSTLFCLVDLWSFPFNFQPIKMRLGTSHHYVVKVMLKCGMSVNFYKNVLRMSWSIHMNVATFSQVFFFAIVYLFTAYVNTNSG